MKKRKETPVVVDNRDSVVRECLFARGYGQQRCSDCARSSGTVYADGYQAGCVNLPKGQEVLFD